LFSDQNLLNLDGTQRRNPSRFLPKSYQSFKRRAYSMKTLLTLSILLFLLTGCTDRPSQEHIESGIKEINGTQLYYKTIGEGESILVIHGGPGLNHNYLLPHLSKLAENYKLIFYDQRACGKSSLNVDTSSITLDNFIRDIEGLRQSFGIMKLNLMGHSWGGLLALEYALKYPGKVKSLILIDCIGASNDINTQTNQVLAERFTKEDSIKRVNIIRTEAFQKRDPKTIEALMQIGFKHDFKNPSLIDSLDLDLNENYAETSRLLQYLAGDLMSYDLHPDLKKIKSPALLIYGDYDPLTETAGRRIQQSIAQSQLKIIEDCGHFPFIEKPDKFNKIVTTFMKNNKNNR
jgi:proline iminopeptidase